jgi:hypothetical protein
VARASASGEMLSKQNRGCVPGRVDGRVGHTDWSKALRLRHPHSALKAPARLESRILTMFKSTPKQAAASRANSQKPTGPRSAAGKAVSRFNALKHGIYAVHQIMFDETPEDLAELSAEYHELYSPLQDGSEGSTFIFRTAQCLRTFLTQPATPPCVRFRTRAVRLVTSAEDEAKGAGTSGFHTALCQTAAREPRRQSAGMAPLIVRR